MAARTIPALFALHALLLPAAAAAAGPGAPSSVTSTAAYFPPQEALAASEIVVTASLRPERRDLAAASVSVVRPEAWERNESRSVADALRDVAGVTVRDYGGPGSLSLVGIRGSSANQVLYLLDGMPMNNAAS